jgi:Sec7-like guanine-nucleotide exchange factor
VWSNASLGCCRVCVQKRQKEETLRAAFKFKAKARDGIAHLIKIGRCTDAPDSIAKVFYELRDVLDKTAMGEFMGGEKELNIKVCTVSVLVSVLVVRECVSSHLGCLGMAGVACLPGGSW